MSEPAQSANPLVELIHLEQAARSARDERTLAFVVLNETLRLIPYRQAFLCRRRGRALRLDGVSGLARVERASPFHDWFEAFLRDIEPSDQITTLEFDRFTENVRKGWEEWLPPSLIAVPLPDKDGGVHSLLLLSRDEPLSATERELLGVLASAYAHAFWALTRSRGLIGRIPGLLLSSRWWLVLAALVPLLVAMPVRQSSLGPAEVAPLTSVAITSPLDGVIAEVLVKPNQDVAKGQVLFRLDETTLRNRLEAARRSLGVAETEAHMIEQKAFVDTQARSEIATQKARVREKGSSIQYLAELLAKLEVKAPTDGVVLFGDATDWEGKPVTVGERIMTLADSRTAGLTAWIPVAEAVALSPETPLRLFLHVDPLRPREAKVLRSSYQPILSPEGIASYRVTAAFDRQGELPRLGLRGTVKVYGEQVRLGYYLFRRPFAAARQRLGF